MPYTSILYPNEPIINDNEGLQHTRPPIGQLRGLRMPHREPWSDESPYEGVADPFPDELLVPESEWEARIKEREERKCRLSDIVDQAGLPCKDQDSTNYCWINAPTHTIEIARVVQNQKVVILSPASAGAIIKNYRNEGGWGKEGLEYFTKEGGGLVPIDKWPANAIDRQYDTPETKAMRKLYRQTEWWELKPRNINQLVSLLFRAEAGCALGYNWWSHEVTAYDPVWIDNKIGIRERNSWGMSYGSSGYFILQGSKMYPDDAVAPRVVIAA